MRDSAALLDAIAGSVDGDPYSAPPPATAFLDAIANGDADKDWSAIARVAARKAGLGD